MYHVLEQHLQKYIVLYGVLFFLVLALGIHNVYCSPVPHDAPEKGSHGYRTWSGDTFKSFNVHSDRICVPHGWEAIGALQVKDSWAEFEPNTTGVLIHSSAYASTTLSFQHSSYAVTLVYPASLSDDKLKTYSEMVINAFENVGTLFNDSVRNTSRPHIVLITAGVNEPYGETAVIYPDPSASVSYVILRPEESRTEELFIHAVMHLYNRYGGSDDSYQEHQEPISKEDWQELEASWAETAFRSSDTGRIARLEYLYGVHQAVHAKDFDSIYGPPFDVRKEFAKMQGGLQTHEGSSFLDVQYSHYILGPLVLLATETLVQQHDATFSTTALLQTLHAGGHKNYFDEIEKIVSGDEYLQIESWLQGTKPIPQDLIFTASERYNKQKN